MKRTIWILLCIILMGLSACSQDNAHNTNLIATLSEMAADDTLVSKTPEEYVKQTYQILFGDGISGYPFYPGKHGSEYNPVMSDSQKVVYPDLLDSFVGVEDSFSGNIMHVAALQVDLSLPEGFFAYVISGQYWDYTRKCSVTLDFVREYVLTTINVSEEKLLQDIQGYFDKEHWSYDPYFRGPGYVVYSFRVFRKEYLPIESLFISLLADSGEVFSAGEYYVSMGEKSIWDRIGVAVENDHVTQIKEFYYPKADPGAICSEFKNLNYYNDKENNDNRKIIEEMTKAGLWYPAEEFPQSKWINEIVLHTVSTGFLTESVRTDPTDGWSPDKPSMFRTGTQGCEIEVANGKFSNYKLLVSNITASICSEEWWVDYQNSLQLLKENPEPYNCGISMDNIEMPEPDQKPGDPYFDRNSYDIFLDYWNNWYMDHQKDVQLRAYIYAGLRRFQTVDETCLSNIIILFKDYPDGTQHYMALLYQEESLLCLEHNWNVLNEVTLDFSREYAEKEI